MFGIYGRVYHVRFRCAASVGKMRVGDSTAKRALDAEFPDRPVYIRPPSGKRGKIIALATHTAILLLL